MIVPEEDLKNDFFWKVLLKIWNWINTEVLKMNVFGGVEEKMPKIEKMLKLRKFANYVLEEQRKNKENWHFVLYYIMLHYVTLRYI